MKKKYKLFILLACFIMLLAGCKIETKITKYSSKDLEDIKFTIKNGMEKGSNFSYETTTGDEGMEYFTNAFRESVHQTEQDKPKIINQRKYYKVVKSLSITNVHDIKLVNNFEATAIADFNEKTTSNSPNKFNHNWTGYYRMKLKKIDKKWLIDDFQSIVPVN